MHEASVVLQFTVHDLSEVIIKRFLVLIKNTGLPLKTLLEPPYGVLRGSPFDMTHHWIHRAAALSGASAVALGAYGAHQYHPTDPSFRKVFDIANQYHLVHSIFLAAVPLASKPSLVARLAIAGIFCFSGSCYAVALTEDRSKGMLAPIGGSLLIAAWLGLAL